jgi:hypothetical protein
MELEDSPRVATRGLPDFSLLAFAGGITCAILAAGWWNGE